MRKIYTLYLSGDSIITIKRKLEEEKIPAPQGDTSWSKRTIGAILTNNKYTGASIVHSSGIRDTGVRRLDPNDLDWDEVYASFDNHPAIIGKEIFDRAQQVKQERSNVVFNPDGTRSRKSTRYSSKKAKRDGSSDGPQSV